MVIQNGYLYTQIINKIMKGVLIGAIICLSIFGIGLGITSVVIGSLSPGDCDFEDTMGLDVGQYLIGLGVFSIVVTMVSIILLILLICEVEPVPVGIALVVVNVISILFGTAWFIVGGIILFRGNIDCIKDGSMHVIYALVLWCLSALNIIFNLCGTKRTQWTRY